LSPSPRKPILSPPQPLTPPPSFRGNHSLLLNGSWVAHLLRRRRRRRRRRWIRRKRKSRRGRMRSC